MIRIGVPGALSTIQLLTWLSGALPKMVDNGTIKPIRVELSPTKQEHLTAIPV
jgi:hypothetical protein